MVLLVVAFLCIVLYTMFFFLKLVFNFAISMLKILLNNRLLAYKT